MGHTINPISNRLKINQYWKSNWCSYTNYNYKYLLFADFYFFKFVFFLFLVLQFALLLITYHIYNQPFFSL